jgi:flagellar biosynthesis protein FlhG
MAPDSTSKTICAVGGGKGGVGKSIFSVALAKVLADSGKKTVLVDLDLGASNLHTYIGIVSKTPTIADFILKKTSSLKKVLIETGHDNLLLISGAEFVPGMANPAHWMKLKIMRHIKSLPADVVILDLGAGVHFNTLDFFGISDLGVVMTSPEPGAVMNAYSFIKGALFRKIQNVFRRHPEIGPVMEAVTRSTGDEQKLSIPWMLDQIRSRAPDMLPVLDEINRSFRPGLVVNRVPEGHRHLLVQNLIALCRERLGITLGYLGNLPDVRDISVYLLDIPGMISSAPGKIYRRAVEQIRTELGLASSYSKPDFSDEEIEEIISLIDGLDENILKGTPRETLKLRMYFKPEEVVEFLRSHGVKEDLLSR